MYDISKISDKLKKARIYRGYKSQAQVSRALNIPKQTWSIWERGGNLPPINYITEISNLLNISPLYFLSNGESDIEKFDLLYCYKSNFSLPFTETRLTDQIYRILNLAVKQLNLYLVETPGGNGITRAIYEWQKRNQNRTLIIYDNITESRVKQVQVQIKKPPEKSTLIVAKYDILQQIKNKLLYKHVYFATEDVGYNDFLKIISKAVPEASLEISTLIFSETCFSLPRLSLFIRKLAQEKMHPKWVMDFDSVMLLCEKIKTQQTINNERSN